MVVTDIVDMDKKRKKIYLDGDIDTILKQEQSLIKTYIARLIVSCFLSV